ncbi:MAG: PASTA domain-containing protein [Acidobacteria bacterium]|nr:PASTA domain-containing protein [Acidobacteriota bacterium]
MAAKLPIVRRLLTVLLLGAVFLLSSGLVLYFALRGRTVQVPNIVGKAEADATDELEDYGLRIAVRNRAHSEQYSANTVSEQVPAPGTVVKTGQQVRVTLSLGAPPAPARK